MLSDSNRGTPAYFHLLWDDDICALQRLFEVIAPRREQVLARWYELYLLHFGDSRSLSKAEFLKIYGVELDGTVEAMLHGDLPQFTSEVKNSGEQLWDRRAPFAELIVSMHLFEESALEAFPKSPPVPPATYLAFDRLSHCRMIVLADTYFRTHSALATARITGLEIEAERIAAEQRTIFRGIVGASAAMRQLYLRIEAAARTRGTVLIVGESGTGKELVAHAIHECGPRPEAPFIPLNCAALPRELIESELFGYKRGAFSGARETYLGLFRAADGGTLFLDEITDMGFDLQSKLLRAIQERKVRPVGFASEISADVRIIASTNVDPLVALESGRLRDDLYYRLQANVLRVPSVRERADDIALLAQHFVTFFSEKMGRQISGIDQAALTAMRDYSWPGNVRELANAIEGAFTFGQGSTIARSDLPSALQASVVPRPPPSANGVPTYAEVERDLFKRALDTSGGNRSEAARMLKISRKKLYDKIAKYDLA